jgi:DNA-directed RNA polymerase specialized sigma24 family protein
LNPAGSGTDPILVDDAGLVTRAREDDRLAFGVLYLRHSEAAWRVACSVSGFSPDAELAVIEGFTTVFEALPAELTPETAFRPHLLAAVRQAALDRLPRPGLGERWRRRPAPRATVIEPELVVLSGMEHHLLIGSLRRLPERWRSALWLTEVERMTPGEAAAVLKMSPAAVTTVAAEARDRVIDASLEVHRRSVFRSGCQHTVDRLGAYVRGQLTPRERITIKAHLDRCLPCRMRRSELTDVAGSLIGALPYLPLMGGECQRHWLMASAATPSVGRARITRAAAPRRVPTQVAAAAAMLAFLFGLTAVVTPRDSGSRTELAAPPTRTTETTDLPPLTDSRPADAEVALLTSRSSAAPAPAPAPAPAIPPTAPPVSTPAPSAGSFTAATVKRPAASPQAKPPAKPPASPPASAAPPAPLPATPASVGPENVAPPAPAPAPAPVPQTPPGADNPVPGGTGTDNDRASDRDRGRDRDRDGDRERRRDRDDDDRDQDRGRDHRDRDDDDNDRDRGTA